MTESSAQPVTLEKAAGWEVTFQEVDRKATWQPSPVEIPVTDKGIFCTGVGVIVPVTAEPRGFKVPHSFLSPAERQKEHSGFLSGQNLEISTTFI